MKILTLDGGGLQAISTLLILNKVLETIADQNGVSGEKPRPCDGFDTIAGIGAGGWLAILLGRFRMDITSCLSEWYKLLQCVTPRSKPREIRLRLLQHSYVDTDLLVEQIGRLTKTYNTGDRLFEDDPAGARTCHVFVAALDPDARGYKLFRSYEASSARMPHKPLEGPRDPGTFTISRAFGVTGAAKYFTPPWKERMAKSGRRRFSDTGFPKPHNITELALNEMWALYGTKVEMSVILNVGPGLPSDADVKQIARRFSWGLNASVIQAERPPRVGIPLASQTKILDEQKSKRTLQFRGIKENHEGPSNNTTTNLAGENAIVTPTMEGEPRSEISRMNTLGSLKGRKFDAKMKRLEHEIESDIRTKLKTVYPTKPPPYFRLAPGKAPEGTSQNDTCAPGSALDATLHYLGSPQAEGAIEEVGKRLPEM